MINNSLVIGVAGGSGSGKSTFESVSAIISAIKRF